MPSRRRTHRRPPAIPGGGAREREGCCWHVSSALRTHRARRRPTAKAALRRTATASANACTPPPRRPKHSTLVARTRARHRGWVSGMPRAHSPAMHAPAPAHSAPWHRPLGDALHAAAVASKGPREARSHIPRPRHAPTCSPPTTRWFVRLRRLAHLALFAAQRCPPRDGTGRCRDDAANSSSDHDGDGSRAERTRPAPAPTRKTKAMAPLQVVRCAGVPVCRTRPHSCAGRCCVLVSLKC
ncbi:hypothetical protein DCS_07769 [Drechmeria coniospora]|uniref:Uncharacterized protein n=1 Tax=Drechmeria coniospora TaxID=98403 RepID=A0A151GFD1_DRECN|nr:hypothetical protein DCS_07769 [Drechmeria coniospora]KYK55805.1 hypothetical protein DCS_07769 [Drechmeria coniospora]